METIDEAINRIGFGRFHIITMIILGHHNMCLAYQVLLGTLLGPLLNTEWKLTTLELYMISSSSYVGIMLGSILIGKLGDQYGRKTTLVLADIVLICFTINTAFSPTVYWIVINQFISGFFSSSLIISNISLLAELMPINVRGTILSSMLIFWCLGSLVITLISFIIISIFNWRIFLIVLSIPIIISVLASLWIPESPRFLLLKNRKKECIHILNRIAKINGSIIIYNIQQESSSKTSFYKDLVHPNYLSTTIITTFVIFVGSLDFYSVVLLVPIINMIPHRCLQDLNSFSINMDHYTNNTKDSSCGYIFDWTSYKNMFISILAELVFGIFSMIFINIIGRKKTIRILMIIIITGMILLNLCLNDVSLTILLFFLRGSCGSNFNLNILYISEVFPTSIKSFMMGFTSTFARTGSVLAPLIVYIIMVKYSYLGGTMVLFSLNILSFIAFLFLPYETKDRKIYQTVWNEDNGNDSTITTSQNYGTLKNN